MKRFNSRSVTAALVAIAATAGLTLTSPVAASAAAPAAVSCVGSIQAQNTDGLLAQQTFWWYQYNASAVCIGSVIYQETVTGKTGLDQRVRIWAEPSNVLLNAYWSGGTQISNGIRFDTVVQQVQPNTRVMVCSAVTEQGLFGGHTDNVVTSVPILCTTVG